MFLGKVIGAIARGAAKAAKVAKGAAGAARGAAKNIAKYGTPKSPIKQPPPRRRPPAPTPPPGRPAPGRAPKPPKITQEQKNRQFFDEIGKASVGKPSILDDDPLVANFKSHTFWRATQDVWQFRDETTTTGRIDAIMKYYERTDLEQLFNEIMADNEEAIEDYREYIKDIEDTEDEEDEEDEEEPKGTPPAKMLVKEFKKPPDTPPAEEPPGGDELYPNIPF